MPDVGFSMWQDVYGAYAQYAPETESPQMNQPMETTNGQYQPNPTIPFISIVIALFVIRLFQEYTGKTNDI